MGTTVTAKHAIKRVCHDRTAVLFVPGKDIVMAEIEAHVIAETRFVVDSW